MFEPKTERIFAFNGRSKNATVIDTHTNKVVETIALPGKPEFPRADGKGTVFVNIEDTSQIARIDAATAKVTALWSIAPCEEPSGMAIDIAHNRLFSVCGNKQMAVVDAASGKVVASPAIGNGPDAAAFDANHAVAFSSNGEGTLTILSQKSANEYSLLQTLPTKQGARTMALDPTTGTVYTVTADFGPRPAATTRILGHDRRFFRQLCSPGDRPITYDDSAPKRASRHTGGGRRSDQPGACCVAAECGGTSVTLAASGNEAVRMLKATEENNRPRAILVDLQMPGMSGDTLAQRLRKQCRSRSPHPRNERDRTSHTRTVRRISA